MAPACVDGAAALPDEIRLSRFGRFLRSTSLDELPELLNVLVGDMALVGPRPLFPSYLPLYSQKHGRRHDVRPGITGLAQVMGRNSLSWKRRFDYDAWYVAHRSAALDAWILYKTVGCVLHRSGISESGHATMSPFVGYSDADLGSPSEKPSASRSFEIT
jgi:lipopolysaccharide/colanic/teichoic acid biosynthesis glycosyltransferase